MIITHGVRLTPAPARLANTDAAHRQSTPSHHAIPASPATPPSSAAPPDRRSPSKATRRGPPPPAGRPQTPASASSATTAASPRAPERDRQTCATPPPRRRLQTLPAPVRPPSSALLRVAQIFAFAIRTPQRGSTGKRRCSLPKGFLLAGR